ncbi:MAG: hypothetical protein QOF89_5144 [Acidobacteriota bacterium]|nr:hypothetical protein [Acidobacteriota bacterium]
MMKKSLLCAAAVLVALVLGSVAAQAQTAAFQGSTLVFSRNGDYRDNGSTCPGGAAPTGYSWNFVEDGTTQSGNPVTHKWVANFCAFTVKLTVTCPGGGTATQTRFSCFSCGTFGCINPDVGYN